MLFMAWTFEVILSVVRSFILCESSVGSTGGGGVDCDASGAADTLLEAMAQAVLRSIFAALGPFGQDC